MDKCPKCGNKLSSADVLCPRCGTFVSKIQAVSFSSSEESNTTHCPEPVAPANETDIPMTRLGRKSQKGPRFEEYEALAAAKLDEESLEEAEKANEPLTSAPEDNDEKNWLEIEEVKDAPSQKAEDNIQTIVQAPEQDPQPDPELQPEPEKTPDVQPQSVDDDTDIIQTRSLRRSTTTQEIQPTPYTPKSKKHLRAPVIVLIWIFVIAAVFTAFYFANTYVVKTYGGWDSFVRQLTDGKIELNTSGSADNEIIVNISEAQTEDGAPAHQFDVSFIGGESVSVLPLGNTYTMSKNSTSFTIADEEIASNFGIVTSDSTFETNGVTINVYTGSQTLTYPVTSLTLTLTDAVYERQSPSLDTLTAIDDTISIELTVAPDATVFINNTNYSGDIDENGNLSVTQSLKEGENIFVVETYQPGRRSVNDTFTVSYEPSKSESPTPEVSDT